MHGFNFGVVFPLDHGQTYNRIEVGSRADLTDIVLADR